MASDEFNFTLELLIVHRRAYTGHRYKHDPIRTFIRVLAAGTNVDGRMGTNGVPLRAVTPPT